MLYSINRPGKMWTCLELAQPQLALRWQTLNINYMPKKCISGPNGEPARKWLKCFEKTQHSRFTHGKRLLWTLTKNSTPFVGTTKQCQSSMPLKEQCSKKEVHCMCEAATITTTKKITVCWEQTRERRVCHKQNNEEEKDTALDRKKKTKKTRVWRFDEHSLQNMPACLTPTQHMMLKTTRHARSFWTLLTHLARL